MKRIAILSLSIMLGLSFAGCARDKDSGSNTNSGLTSGLSGETSESNTSISDNGSSVASSRYSSEYEALLTQLDDLEKALNELDQVSNGDVEIPTP